MNPEEILKLAGNPNNIPGIYNYCDRWCERCTFTSRCFNRELSSEREKRTEDLDRNNKKYWEEIGKSFSDTRDLIAHITQKMGIDLTLVDDQEVEKHLEKGKSAVKNARFHTISIEAKKYSKMMDDFFEKEKELFGQKENEMNLQLELGLNEEKIKNEVEELKDIFEILNWYNPQIWVKLMRALSGKFKDDNPENEFPKDSDGSAKVALIGIDRSSVAWGKLCGLFPEKTDDLISVLLHLDKLKKHVENEFPQARNFIRPGFDEIC